MFYVFAQGQARGYGCITHFFDIASRGPWFSHATMTKPISGFQIQGTKWKIWISSFHRYLFVHCRSSGLVTERCESWVLFSGFFSKITYFGPRMKTAFLILFSKCSHLITISQKWMKPNVNGHKYPRFSYPEKYLKNFKALLSYSSFKRWPSKGSNQKGNEWVIRQYPLAIVLAFLQWVWRTLF